MSILCITVLSIQLLIFLVVVLCISSAGGYDDFGERCCLHLHGWSEYCEDSVGLDGEIARKISIQVHKGAGERNRTQKTTVWTYAPATPHLLYILSSSARIVCQRSACHTTTHGWLMSVVESGFCSSAFKRTSLRPSANDTPQYLLMVVPTAVGVSSPSPAEIFRSAAARMKQSSPVVQGHPCFHPAALGPVVGTPGPLGSAPVLGSIGPFASTVRTCWGVRDWF